MLSPSDIHPGLVLRLINSHGLGAPVGALATVKAIETSRSGDWLCIVQYHDRKQPKHGTRLYRSHLWATDLGRFEIAKAIEKESPHSTVGTPATPKLPMSRRSRGLVGDKSVHHNQLSLFSADDF